MSKSPGFTIRARRAQIEYWREASQEAGYRSLSLWVKDVLTKAATQVFRDKDEEHGPATERRGRPKKHTVGLVEVTDH